MLKHGFSVENIKRGLSNPFLVFDEVVLQHIYRVPSAYVNGKYQVGTNVFDREWDVLVILDTCRVDALREVSDEYEFLTEIESMWSVGGATPEWIARTFDRDHIDEIHDTAYLSATTQLRGVLDERLPSSRSLRESHLAYKALAGYDSVGISDLGYVEYLSEYEPIGETGPLGHEDGLTPPRYVTDRGIAVRRDREEDRLVLHYSQPHTPYVTNAIEEDRELFEYEARPLQYLRGGGDYDLIWELYLNELRKVLDEVELLLENMDAETIAITADHGEGFGEYGIYGHQIGSLHPYIRKVPWVETTASDTGTYIPSVDPPDSSREETDQSTEELLEAMGYKF